MLPGCDASILFSTHQDQPRWSVPDIAVARPNVNRRFRCALSPFPFTLHILESVLFFLISVFEKLNASSIKYAGQFRRIYVCVCA